MKYIPRGLPRMLLAAARRGLPEEFREEFCDAEWAAELHAIQHRPDVPRLRRWLDAVCVTAGWAWSAPTIAWALTAEAATAAAAPSSVIWRTRVRQVPPLAWIMAAYGGLLAASVIPFLVFQTELWAALFAEAAALLMVVVGGKFLFGEQKSLAGFMAFTLLGGYSADLVAFGLPPLLKLLSSLLPG